ncbi:MAG: penicillin acylase family protein [Chitinophagaceae bacterium]|nr:penicillin acylase family protein [Chitinophagaceae bacterium]
MKNYCVYFLSFGHITHAAMRIFPFVVSAFITSGYIYLFDHSFGPLPMAPGRFLSPQHGFWQNAEAENYSFNTQATFSGLKGKAEVYFDERLVPHVFAENDEDLYFIQGYLHARFRLFQMDLQTRGAEGRISEIAGKKAIPYDREQRRLGMVYAAENAVKAIESDSVLKKIFDAYTNGVNAYIESLREADIPVEYKILHFKPQKWTNLRTALLLKMMAKILSSGAEKDLGYTRAKSVFLPEELKKLYPQINDSLIPIIPQGTSFPRPASVPALPADVLQNYFLKKDSVATENLTSENSNNGSNNWAIAGSKTASGSPMLCNDPHLELSLPSIWYEMQLSSPSCNVYGVSLPGSPLIIIGFNDSIAWGLTNAQRDVKDYYEIQFRDSSRTEYWFNGEWKKAERRVEVIKVKGEKDYLDTVAYTVFGPVMYDHTFQGIQNSGLKKNLAVRWIAHDPTNEALTLYKLNRAKNYEDYVKAIETFGCPAQNFLFASASGDIAIWQQGKFPLRWEGQGMFIMPGKDSSYLWKNSIPFTHNPNVKNPPSGFIQSANQRPVDVTYPYYIPGTYIAPRGIAIARKLAAMQKVTVRDMMQLQLNYFNVVAEDARPHLLRYIRENDLTEEEKKYLALFKSWDLNAMPESKGQTVFQHWWDSLKTVLWNDELNRVSPPAPMPDEQTTLELLIKDSALIYTDKMNTPEKETWSDVVTESFRKAASALKALEQQGNLTWANAKNTTIYHLIKDFKGFSISGLDVGGFGNIINAIGHSHGPSWRMIVHLSKPYEAYGVYPGGQSGNPGSRFYDSFVKVWEKGEYYTLWFMKETEKNSPKIKWVMKFQGKN